MSGASISSATIPDSALASTFLKTSSTNYCDTSNAQTIAGIKTFSSPPVMSGASISSGSIQASSLSQTYLTTSSASSTYQPLLSSSVSAIADMLTVNRINERIQSCTVSAGSTTLNYANGSVWYISGTAPSSNFSVTISNLPVSNASTTQFTISLIYNSATACYCNNVTVTDSSSASVIASSTPKYLGGSAPSLSNSSVYIQTFTVLQCFGTKYCITNVVTFN